MCSFTRTYNILCGFIFGKGPSAQRQSHCLACIGPGFDRGRVVTYNFSQGLQLGVTVGPKFNRWFLLHNICWLNHPSDGDLKPDGRFRDFDKNRLIATATSPFSTKH